MLDKKAPSGAARGGAVVSVTSTDQTTAQPQYSRKTPKKQDIRNLSNLVDQALSRAEYHDGLAHFHACEAAKHRKILWSLQSLILTEGEVSNG